MKAGITGHQELGGPESVAWIVEALHEQVGRHAVTEGLTSLAAGADQLFASLLVERGIPFTAVIPSASYEDAFSDYRSREQFRALLDSASSVVQLDFSAPSELAFFEAGKHIVDNSDVLFAIWDGRLAKGLGGTGDIVAYTRTENKPLVHIDHVRREVVEL